MAERFCQKRYNSENSSPQSPHCKQSPSLLSPRRCEAQTKAPVLLTNTHTKSKKEMKGHTLLSVSTGGATGTDILSSDGPLLCVWFLLPFSQLAESGLFSVSIFLARLDQFRRRCWSGVSSLFDILEMLWKNYWNISGNCVEEPWDFNINILKYESCQISCSFESRGLSR